MLTNFDYLFLGSKTDVEQAQWILMEDVYLGSEQNGTTKVEPEKAFFTKKNSVLFGEIGKSLNS